MKCSALFLCILLSCSSHAQNLSNPSFSKAKKMLEKSVYNKHRVTLYCAASFNADKSVIPPKGFHSPKYKKRSKKIEWEHVVPAENFGRTFKEWRVGDPNCVSSKGKSFKGRKCANKVNSEYRYMQADMFNLFPAIGSVNALRSNYNFAMQPGEESDFGSCAMKIANRKAEPPQAARGQISRAYLYMESTYPRYSMSRQQRQLMNAWDKQYPVERWECRRTKKIAALQKGANDIVKSRCVAKKLW